MIENFVYSTIVKLPEENSRNLQKLIKKIDVDDGQIKKENSFHITMESKLHSLNEDSRTNLDKLLGVQKSFDITLNKVDIFIRDRGCILFLTTDDQNEKDKIAKLHSEIYKIVRPPELSRLDKYEYIPHVTLLSRVPLEKICRLRDEVEDNYKDYLNFRVSQVTVSKRENYGEEWEECYRVNLKDNGFINSQEGRLILRPRLFSVRAMS